MVAVHAQNAAVLPQMAVRRSWRQHRSWKACSEIALRCRFCRSSKRMGPVRRCGLRTPTPCLTGRPASWRLPTRRGCRGSRGGCGRLRVRVCTTGVLTEDRSAVDGGREGSLLSSPPTRSPSPTLLAIRQCDRLPPACRAADPAAVAGSLVHDGAVLAVQHRFVLPVECRFHRHAAALQAAVADPLDERRLERPHRAHQAFAPGPAEQASASSRERCWSLDVSRPLTFREGLGEALRV